MEVVVKLNELRQAEEHHEQLMMYELFDKLVEEPYKMVMEGILGMLQRGILGMQQDKLGQGLKDTRQLQLGPKRSIT